MNKMLVPMFLPLLLEMVIPVTPRLNSVQVIAYRWLTTTRKGPPLCAIDLPYEITSSSSLQDCSLKCGRDGTCTGFNIKNPLTCGHTNTLVLVSTSKTRWPARCTNTNRTPCLSQAARSTRFIQNQTFSLYVESTFCDVRHFDTKYFFWVRHVCILYIWKMLPVITCCHLCFRDYFFAAGWIRK